MTQPIRRVQPVTRTQPVQTERHSTPIPNMTPPNRRKQRALPVGMSFKLS